MTASSFPFAMSQHAPFRKQTNRLAWLEIQVRLNLANGLFRTTRRRPQADRPRQHHRGLKLRIYPSSRLVFEIGVIPFAMIGLHAPMESLNFLKIPRILAVN